MGTGLKADLIRNANETSKKPHQTIILLALKRWGGGGQKEKEKLQGKFASTFFWQKR